MLHWPWTREAREADIHVQGLIGLQVVSVSQQDYSSCLLLLIALHLSCLVADDLHSLLPISVPYPVLQDELPPWEDPD